MPRALTPEELQDINLVARTSGNDVILDALLLRLHTETACRRGGALGLRLMDLDTEHGLVRLREKGGTLRWQPISLDLAVRLAEHAPARGAVLPTDGLLRFRNGRTVSSRRYDHPWWRLGQRLPWAARRWRVGRWLGSGDSGADGAARGATRRQRHGGQTVNLVGHWVGRRMGAKVGMSADGTRMSTRRALLATGGAAGVSVALAGCGGDRGGPPGAPAPVVTSAAVLADGGGSTPTGDGDSAATPTGGVSSIKTTDIPVNGGKIFPDMGPDGVVVTQPTPGQFRAFSATCTHRGCTLASVSGGTINCPCHGGRFSIRNGSVVQAGDGIPAQTSPLPAKKVTVSGDTIAVS